MASYAEQYQVMKTLEGKWKEDNKLAEDTSNFLKAIGLPKSIRGLSKKINAKVKFKIISDEENSKNLENVKFSTASAAGKFMKNGPSEVEVNVVLDHSPEKEEKPGQTGWTKATATIFEAGLKTETIIVKPKPKSDAENIKADDKIITLVKKIKREEDGKDYLKIQTWFVPNDLAGKTEEDWEKDTKMTKFFKYKGEATNMEIEEED